MVAWNSVKLCIPSEWEVSSLANFYLQLDDGEGVVLDLKWQRVKGTFSHKASLRRLARSSTGASRPTFKIKTVPEGWRRALSSFEVQAFAWEGSESRGEGAILYCPTCRTATLLQFYHRLGQIESLVQEQLLRSFRDHSEDGWITWSLFGISASVPQRFSLNQHQFQPGHYQLVFHCKKERLEFKRWGPADVLLKQGGLKKWYDEKSGGGRQRPLCTLEADEYHGQPALRGQTKGAITFMGRLWIRITGRYAYNWIRIWHHRPMNQILGVEASDSRQLDESLLEEICGSYDMVPQAEKAGD